MITKPDFCFNIFILFGFIIIPGFTLSQHTVSLRGNVSSGTGIEAPIKNATVLILSNSIYKGSCLTDENGNCNFSLEIFPYDTLLIIRAIESGYIIADYYLEIEKSRIEYLFKIFLIKNKPELDTVVVSANSKMPLFRGDTVSFSAPAFRDLGDNNLINLLNKIPGFSALDDGTIKYRNQEISELLLEGEKITNSSYKSIAGLIDPHILDRVEIVNNFISDRLLKNFLGSSDEIALNLTLANEFKYKLNGYVNLGGWINRHSISSNLMMLGKKDRLFFSAASNNVGESPSYSSFRQSGMLSFFPNQAYDKAVEQHLYSNDVFVNEPSIDRNYFLRNNDYQAELNYSKKLGNKFLVRVGGHLNESMYSVRALNENFVNPQTGSAWFINGKYRKNSNFNLFNGDVEIKFDNTKKFTSILRLNSYNTEYKSNFNSEISGIIEDSFKNDYLIHPNLFNLISRSVLKINSKYLFKFELESSLINFNDSSYLETQRLANRFSIPIGMQSFRQENILQDLNIQFKAGLLRKRGNNLSKIEGVWEYNRRFFNGGVNWFNKLENSYDKLYELYAQDTINSSRIYCLYVSSIPLNKKNLLTFTSNFGIQYFNTEKFNTKVSSPIYEIDISAIRIASEQTKFSFSIFFKNSLPAFQYFSPSVFFNPTPSIQYSLRDPVFINYLGTRFNLLSSSIRKAKHFSLFGSLTFGRSSIADSSIISPDIFQRWNVLINERNIMLSLNAKYEVPIIKLKSKWQLEGGLFGHFSPIYVNNIKAFNSIKTSSLKTSIITKIKPNFSWINTSELRRFENQLNYSMNISPINITINNSSSLRLSWKSGYMGLRYSHYMLNRGSHLSIFDLYGKVQLNNKISLDGTARNIGNLKVATFRSISSTSISQDNFELLGRIIYTRIILKI